MTSFPRSLLQLQKRGVDSNRRDRERAKYDRLLHAPALCLSRVLLQIDQDTKAGVTNLKMVASVLVFNLSEAVAPKEFVKRGTVNLWRDTTANSVGRRFEQYRWISRRLECRVFPTVLPQHFQEREDVFPYLLLRFAHVSVFALSSLNGAPEGSRTPNLQIRSLALYPVELQVREKRARTSNGSHRSASDNFEANDRFAIRQTDGAIIEENMFRLPRSAPRQSR